MERLEPYLPILKGFIEQGMLFFPKIVLALAILWIGLKSINYLTEKIRDKLESTKFDLTLGKFLSSMVGWALKAMLLISVATMLGVETTSFIAVIGAASLAIGLSLQGALANFAGGMLIMIFRPYRVGDLIESQGHLGAVTEIQVFNTILRNNQNHQIILPNGAVAGADIKNYTALGKMRVDTTIGIAYGADLKAAKVALLEMMQSNPKILLDPKPTVGVLELADSSVNLTVRPWSLPKDYWDVQLEVMEGSKLALDKAGVTIPFPQMDVHISK